MPDPHTTARSAPCNCALFAQQGGVGVAVAAVDEPIQATVENGCPANGTDTRRRIEDASGCVSPAARKSGRGQISSAESTCQKLFVNERKQGETENCNFRRQNALTETERRFWQIDSPSADRLYDARRPARRKRQVRPGGWFRDADCGRMRPRMRGTQERLSRRLTAAIGRSVPSPLAGAANFDRFSEAAWPRHAVAGRSAPA